MSTYTSTISNMWLSVFPEDKPRGCGYFYTITNHFSVTAFRTRAALMRWLDTHGIAPESNVPEIPPRGESGTSVRLIGEYREALHMDPEAFGSIPHVKAMRALQNGQYTMALVTVDDDGIRTIHKLNPNVPRPTYDYAESRKLEDAGVA